MQIVIGFFLLLIATQSFGQSVLHGKISYQNSGGSPAVGVEVNAIGANQEVSNSSGLFTLTSGSKKIGNYVSVIIGGTDGNGERIEVVNTKELSVNLPSNPGENLLEIIVCPQGQRDAAVIRYQGILAIPLNEQFDKHLNKIEEKLRRNDLDEAALASLQEEKRELIAERDAAKVKIEEQARFIASINLDQASKLVQKAIQKINKGENVESALKVLNDVKLEEAYQSALLTKSKSDEEIKQVIEGYNLKISLLLSGFNYRDAIPYYERIIEIIQQNNFKDPYSLGIKYYEFAEVLQDFGEYKRAVEFYNKSISAIEKIDKRDEKLDKILISSKVRIHDLTSDPFDLTGNERLVFFLVIPFLEKYYDKDDPAVKFLKGYYNYIKVNGDADLSQDSLVSLQWEFVNSIEKNDDEYSSTFDLRSNLFLYEGDTSKAINTYYEGLELLRINYDSNYVEIAEAYEGLASLYSSINDYQKALYSYLKLLDVLKEKLSDTDPKLASAYVSLGLYYKLNGQYEKAIEVVNKGISIEEEVLSPTHLNLSYSYTLIADFYRDLKEFEKVAEFNLKAASIWEVVWGATDFKVGKAYSEVAGAYYRLSSFDSALHYQKKAFEIFKKGLPESEWEFNDTKSSLIILFYKRGYDLMDSKQYDEAITSFNDVLQFDINSFESISLYSLTLKHIATCYTYLKKFDEAIAYELKYLESDPAYKFEEFYSRIGYLYAKKMELRKARRAFRKFKRIHSYDKGAGRSTLISLLDKRMDYRTLSFNIRVHYNWTVFYAMKGDKEKALYHLQKAIELGYNNLEWIKSESCLDILRKEKAFQKITEELER